MTPNIQRLTHLVAVELAKEYNEDQPRDAQGRWAGSGKDPATMKPGEINRELDRLARASSQHNDRLIAAGRGSETFSDSRVKAKAGDADAQHRLALSAREQDLRDEMRARTGDASGHMPTGRGFGPRKGDGISKGSNMTFEQLMENFAALRKADAKAKESGDPHESNPNDPHTNTPLDFSDGRAVAQAAAEDEAARAKLAARLQARSNGDPTIKAEDTDMDETLSQHTPPAGSLGDHGRLAAARAIRAAHKCASGNIVKTFFAARPAASPQIDLDTLHLTNDRLRKSDADTVRALAAAGIRIKPATGNASVAVFKQMKATLSPTLPGQNSNSVWGDAPAGRAGAVSAESANANDPARAGRRPTPTAGSPPHSASIRVMQPPPTEKVDRTLEAIKLVHASGPSGMWGR